MRANLCLFFMLGLREHAEENEAADVQSNQHVDDDAQLGIETLQREVVPHHVWTVHAAAMGGGSGSEQPRGAAADE